MNHIFSRFVTGVTTLLVVTPLLSCRLVAQAGVASDAGAYQPASPLEGSGAPPPIPDQEQPEVLSRGPVHEAFAEPVTLQPQAGLLAPDEPPPNIQEIPPAERPQGQEFVWIPGYWSWDADRNGYIWVSACWRAAPPRMFWMPGYWSRVAGGWEWVAGFWTPAAVREVEYLPAPPSDDDLEPHGPPPSPDTIWVPPCMYWAQDQYVRRDGYWLEAQPNWVWIPSHYVLTPRGYVFAQGHWDYPLERRGVLFAPVYFPPSVYGRMNVTFSPSIVIGLGFLRLSLFAYPRYSHYFFGDYYDDAYLSIGIFPWFDSRHHHTWYDPVYEHDCWRNRRSDPNWEDRERDDYHRRSADKNLRPARTYREQESRVARLPESQRRVFQVTQPIAVVTASRDTPLKFARIKTEERAKISKQSSAVRVFRDERNRWESKPAELTTVQPPDTKRGATVTQPVIRKEKGPATPVAKREPSFVPPREIKVPNRERVSIPVPPVVGGSGVPGIFRKGPPARPADEDKVIENPELRKNKADDKDPKKAKKDNKRDS